MRFSIYRYDPEAGGSPRMQDYEVKLRPGDHMVLDALMRIHESDETLSFRRSCREGVCGSDGMNINGRNRLACVTALKDLQEPVVLRPLPGQPVIRDLIVDLAQFFAHYASIRPWVIDERPMPERERLQTPEQRADLDGLYECILCACCSTACPSYWWNPDKFIGPAGLLQAYRFVADSRDQDSDARLDFLEGPFKLYRCRTIMNCTEVCPKGLEPSRAIEKLRWKMLQRSF
jgi:succinate dehydrogenase / fumarate reductase iron-sulfur subunit